MCVIKLLNCKAWNKSEKGQHVEQLYLFFLVQVSWTDYLSFAQEDRGGIRWREGSIHNVRMQ